MSLPLSAQTVASLRAVRRAGVSGPVSCLRRRLAHRSDGCNRVLLLPHPCRCFASSSCHRAAASAVLSSSSSSTRRFSSLAAEPAAATSPFVTVNPEVKAPAAPPEPTEQAEVRHFLSSLPVDLSEHADKFLSWSHVLNASTRALKGLGLSIKHRKLLLKHRERYKEAMRRLEHQQVLQAARVSAAAAGTSPTRPPSAQELQQALYDVSHAHQYARQWRRAEEREAAHWWRQSVEMDRLRKTWTRNEWNGVHVQTNPPSMKPLRNPQAMKARLEEEVRHLREQEKSGLADFLDRLAIVEDSQLEDENWKPLIDEMLVERRAELKDDEDLREEIKDHIETRLQRLLDGEPEAVNAVREEVGLPPLEFAPPTEDDGSDDQQEGQQQLERKIDVQVVSSGEEQQQQQLSEAPAQEDGKKEGDGTESNKEERKHAVLTSGERADQGEKDGLVSAEEEEEVEESRTGLDRETLAALDERMRQEDPEYDKQVREMEARLQSDPELRALDSPGEDEEEELQEFYEDTLDEMVDEVIDGPEVEPGLRYIINEEIYTYDPAKDFEMEDGPPYDPPTKEEIVQNIEDIKTGRIHQRLDRLDLRARQLLTLEGLERVGSDHDAEAPRYRMMQGEKERIEAEVRWRQQQRELRIKANLESASPVPPVTFELEAAPEYGIEAQTLVVPAEPKEEDTRDPLVIKLEEQRFRQQSLQKLFALKKDSKGGQ